jgi:hypothetical protein
VKRAAAFAKRFPLGKLWLKKGTVRYSLGADSIVAVEPSFKMVNIYTCREVFMESITAQSVAKNLAGFKAHFVEIARSVYVNKGQVESIERRPSLNEGCAPTWVFLMKSGHRFIGSRRLGLSAARSCGFANVRKPREQLKSSPDQS